MYHRKDRIERERRPDIYWNKWPNTAQQEHFACQDYPLNETSRPEVAEDALVAWGIAQSETTKNPVVKIDMLHGEGADLTWQRDIDDIELGRILNLPHKNARAHSLRMVFINTLNSNTSWLPGNFDIGQETMRILRKTGISTTLLSNLYHRQGYWAKMGTHQCVQYDDLGAVRQFELCYQYRCGWDTGVSFIDLIRTPNQSLYFCINFPSCAMTRLEAVVRSNPLMAHRDFLPDILVADDSLKEWQHELGKRRDLLQRNEENEWENRFQEEDDYKRATVELHTLARHWLILGQDCEDFQSQLRFLGEAYTKFRDVVAPQAGKWHFDKTVNMCESIDMLISQCERCIRWANTYNGRTSLRINLLFHLSNQRESRTNTQIAASSAEIARQAQRDSASMITIAAVTMVFLPSTFISAILSTTFFDYGDDGLHVSSKWWVLLATSIPLTIIVFAVWLGWRYKRLQDHKLEIPVQLPS
ncbi:hypothetical protein ACN47E_002056 [Coniothyrium glycines]